MVYYCVPNISSRVSRTATFAISNILAPSLLKMGIQGGIEEYMKKEDGSFVQEFTFIEGC